MISHSLERDSSDGAAGVSAGTKRRIAALKLPSSRFPAPAWLIVGVLPRLTQTLSTGMSEKYYFIAYFLSNISAKSITSDSSKFKL